MAQAASGCHGSVIVGVAVGDRLEERAKKTIRRWTQPRGEPGDRYRRAALASGSRMCAAFAISFVADARSSTNGPILPSATSESAASRHSSAAARCSCVPAFRRVEVEGSKAPTQWSLWRRSMMWVVFRSSSRRRSPTWSKSVASHFLARDDGARPGGQGGRCNRMRGAKYLTIAAARAGSYRVCPGSWFSQPLRANTFARTALVAGPQSRNGQPLAAPG